MLIIPAINIKNGQCVAISNNQILEAQSYSDDPSDIVGRWFDKGVRRVHIIDLDGALEGRAVNAKLICQLAFRFPNLPMQVSGGICTLVEIEAYLNAGLDYVALGTKAFENSEFALKAAHAFPGQIMISIDAKGGKVLSNARTKTSELDVINFANTFDQASIAGIIYSDVLTDDQSINIDGAAKLASLLTVPLMVSGGIEDIDDVRALFAESHKGIMGAISESALRKGSLDFVEAQAYCDEFED